MARKISGFGLGRLNTVGCKTSALLPGPRYLNASCPWPKFGQDDGGKKPLFGHERMHLLVDMGQEFTDIVMQWGQAADFG